MENPLKWYARPVRLRPGSSASTMQRREKIGRDRWRYAKYDKDILLTIEATDKCTLRCDHCFAEAGPEKNTFIDHEKIDDVAEECKALFPKYKERLIRITGGDPFLHPKMLDIIRSFSKRRSELGYTNLDVETNGWWAKDDNATREHVKKLKDAGADLLSMTMDYYHCKQGVFDIDDHFKRIKRIAKEEGLKFRHINTGTGPTEYDEKTQREFDEHRKNCKQCDTIPLAAPIGRARQLDPKMWQGTHHCNFKGCRLSPPTFMGQRGAPYVHTDEVTIGPNGNVYPCNSGKEFEHATLSLGNIYKKPLQEIWEKHDNKIVKLLKTRGLRALTRRAGIPTRWHWALYWHMTPCGLCHEVLRKAGKEVTGKDKPVSTTKKKARITR